MSSSVVVRKSPRPSSQFADDQHRVFRLDARVAAFATGAAVPLRREKLYFSTRLWRPCRMKRVPWSSRRLSCVP